MSERIERIDHARQSENVTIPKKQLRLVLLVACNLAALLFNGSFGVNNYVQSRKDSKAVTVDQLQEQVNELKQQNEETRKDVQALTQQTDRIYKLLLPRRQSERK
jgi:outer membrane murein-binding lipoprotein Lpp